MTEREIMTETEIESETETEIESGTETEIETVTEIETGTGIAIESVIEIVIGTAIEPLTKLPEALRDGGDARHLHHPHPMKEAAGALRNGTTSHH